jgi:hypothetical protein
MGLDCRRLESGLQTAWDWIARGFGQDCWRLGIWREKACDRMLNNRGLHSKSFELWEMQDWAWNWEKMAEDYERLLSGNQTCKH